MSPPSPASLSLFDADAPGDIEARILLVEQRLIAREAQVRRRVNRIGEQLGDTLQPKRLLLPAVGVAAGLMALFSLRGHGRSAGPVAPATPSGGRTMLSQLPWVRLIALTWPMLPERWRARVSPAAATSFVTLGLPLLERLLGSHHAAQPLQTAAAVDLARLSGRWFMVGELPAPVEADPVEPPELGLLPREDGQFDLLQRRIDRRGTHGRQAIVQFLPESQGARLRVSHWPALLHSLPWAWSELAVLHVDAGYDEALIGSPSRETLWLWSRSPQLHADRRQALVQIARDRGFAVERLRFSSAA